MGDSVGAITASMQAAPKCQMSIRCHCSGGQGVCHRDLKLENTLLDGRPAPRLKICDFGYSKSAVFDSQPKSTVGTPAYIAPEVRPPVCCLAILLYFMLVNPPAVLCLCLCHSAASVNMRILWRVRWREKFIAPAGALPETL